MEVWGCVNGGNGMWRGWESESESFTLFQQDPDDDMTWIIFPLRGPRNMEHGMLDYGFGGFQSM